MSSIKSKASVGSADTHSFAFELSIREVNGQYRLATGDEVIQAARRAIARKFRRGTSLTTPTLTKDYLRLQLAPLEHEIFACVFVDSRHCVLSYQEMFRGTVDGASVHPREVVKEALHQNAAAVIFAHCHPSGNPEPSRADELITMKLRDALALVDIRVLDHIIVAGPETCSMAERGFL